MQKSVERVVIGDVMEIDRVNRYKKERVVGDPLVSLSRLAKLVEEGEQRVRREAKENPHTSPKILAQLAKNEDWRVREAVAKNLFTPPDVLAILTRDKNANVRWAARENPSAPLELDQGMNAPTISATELPQPPTADIS